MTDPVFVIHGVGTRDRQSFEDRVARLQVATGDQCEMKAVYWGDLGADDRWIHLTVPSAGDLSGLEASSSGEIRDGAARPTNTGQMAELAAALLAGFPVAEEPIARDLANTGGARLAAAAAARQLTVTPDDATDIRDSDAASDAQVAMTEAIIVHWESTIWLRQVRDPLLLEEIGSFIGTALIESDVTAKPLGEELRDAEIRAFDVDGFVKRRISHLDRIVGATIGAAAGRLNSYMRTEQGPGITRFFGDVLVYQRRRNEIHQRIRACVNDVDSSLGRDPDHPARIIGHSLGGVIAVDVATAEQPLWTRTLVTFGSQSPFFHVCDPRGGQLSPFRQDHRVRLPASLGGWTNLWEPMDPLAFIAAKVFRMHDGSAPIDVKVPHLMSSGLWTHSAYWQLKPVAEAIRHALEPKLV